MIFNEILPNMLQLSTDVFANCKLDLPPLSVRFSSADFPHSFTDVIQKFFEKGSQAQKTAMAQVLEGQVLPLSLHRHGSRVVEKVSFLSFISPLSLLLMLHD